MTKMTSSSQNDHHVQRFGIQRLGWGQTFWRVISHFGMCTHNVHTPKTFQLLKKNFLEKLLQALFFGQKTEGNDFDPYL